MVFKHKTQEGAADDFQESQETALASTLPNVPVVTAEKAASDAAQAQAQVAAAKKPDGNSILDLPDDVKKNIVGYEDMELDEMLMRIIESFTAAITVDRMVQLLWTTWQRSPDRGKVMQRLRFLAKCGTVVKVEGSRSMYRAAPPLITAEPVGKPGSITYVKE